MVVIDCPGADTFLSRLGHASADTLVTPINDSYVDFAMLAKVDPDNRWLVIRPTVYSEIGVEARKRRFSRDRGRIDWIVMRTAWVRPRHATSATSVPHWKRWQNVLGSERSRVSASG